MRLQSITVGRKVNISDANVLEVPEVVWVAYVLQSGRKLTTLI